MRLTAEEKGGLLWGFSAMLVAGFALLARRRRNLWVTLAVVMSLILVGGLTFALMMGDEDALGAACTIGGFFAIFGCIILWSGFDRIKKISE